MADSVGVVVLDNRADVADRVHLTVLFAPFVLESVLSVPGAVSGSAFARVRPAARAPIP